MSIVEGEDSGGTKTITDYALGYDVPVDYMFDNGTTTSGYMYSVESIKFISHTSTISSSENTAKSTAFFAFTLQWMDSNNNVYSGMSSLVIVNGETFQMIKSFKLVHYLFEFYQQSFLNLFKCM